MTDHATFTEFERRLAEELARYAAPAHDPRTIAAVAATAMLAGRPRSWSAPWSRRTVLGIAALLLLGLAIALAAAANVLRTATPDAYRAVVTRPVDGGLEVVLADADGHERVLRHLTPEGLGLEPSYVLDGAGTVSQRGWLEIFAYVSHPADSNGITRSGVSVLVDLADTAKASIIVPGNGFTGGRWGPDGQYALYCGYPPDCGQVPLGEPNIGSAHAARVLDPEKGASSEIIVTHVQLHGGGPEIVWAADGSGFLTRSPSWGVNPLDSGPYVKGVPKVLSRWWAPTPLGSDHPTEVSNIDEPGVTTEISYEGERIRAAPVAEQFSADGQAIWQLWRRCPIPVLSTPSVPSISPWAR
jgi:hypothetical protein